MCSNPWEESDSYKVSLLLYEDAVLYRKKTQTIQNAFEGKFYFFHILLVLPWPLPTDHTFLF